MVVVALLSVDLVESVDLVSAVLVVNCINPIEVCINGRDTILSRLRQFFNLCGTIIILKAAEMSTIPISSYQVKRVQISQRTWTCLFNVIQWAIFFDIDFRTCDNNPRRHRTPHKVWEQNKLDVRSSKLSRKIELHRLVQKQTGTNNTLPSLLLWI